jgi:beta-lactamase class D
MLLLVYNLKTRHMQKEIHLSANVFWLRFSLQLSAEQQLDELKHTHTKIYVFSSPKDSKTILMYYLRPLN